jgi:ADP-ribose pyrophosphatase YjhB (NUDIX family)
MNRHFTCTGFLVRGDKTLLLWHPRLRMWVPPGGHLEPDEDPVTAVLREIREETGLAAEVLPLNQIFPFAYPGQVAPPFTILLEDSAEPGQRHQHIDLIYFCRPQPEADPPPAEADSASPGPPPDTIVAWVDEETLRADRPIDLVGCGVSAPVSEDVRLLALTAIESARSLGF